MSLIFKSESIIIKSNGRLTMKKSLACEEMGITGCTFEARSEKKDEIKDALLSHAQKFHPEIMSNLSDKQKNDMMSQMENKLK
jgi:predicted small metal-binding protein